MKDISFDKSLGSALRSEREKKNLSQQDIADRCMDYINRKKSVNAEALTLKSQYDDVVKRLKNLEDAVEHGIYNDTTQQRMLDLQKRRDDLSDAMIKAEMQEPGHITRDQIVSVLQSMRGDPSDEQYRIRMIDMFLNAVYVYPDDNKMVITINFQTEKGDPISYETACELYDECSSLAQSGSPFEHNTNTVMVPVSDSVVGFVCMY